MKHLIDTHIRLWALLDDDRLPKKAGELLTHTGNDVYYSIISLWEIELKHLLHPTQMPINAQAIDVYAQEAGFQGLPLHDRHIFALSSLYRPDTAKPHKDPFDRLLICQAKCENMVFLTHDTLLADYNEPCVCLV